MFKIGDKFKKPNSPIIWTVIEVNNITSKSRIEYNPGKYSNCSMWVSDFDLTMSYVKINEEDNNQLDFAGMYGWDDSLPEGDNKGKDCNHEWKVYHGLNFSDEYCSKCNKVRELISETK